MNAGSNKDITGVILFSVVYGLFLISALMRIRNSWRVLHTANITDKQRIKNKLDLIFSGIFLVATIIFFAILIINLDQ
jgi:hypothetical protein